MGLPARKEDQHFTYRDYLAWPDDERWELIEGTAWSMAAAPNRWHQKFLANSYTAFREYFQGKPCEVYFAPFDVVLPEPGQTAAEADTVVQPDLVVICDASKLTDAGCTGAPDFVLEILSPSTAFKDMDQKRRLYEARGVQEYWIANPANKTLMVYRRVPGPGFGKPLLFGAGDAVEPGLFPGLKVSIDVLFAG